MVEHKEIWETLFELATDLTTCTFWPLFSQTSSSCISKRPGGHLNGFEVMETCSPFSVRTLGLKRTHNLIVLLD